jgi:hypothetical protein
MAVVTLRYVEGFFHCQFEAHRIRFHSSRPENLEVSTSSLLRVALGGALSDLAVKHLGVHIRCGQTLSSSPQHVTHLAWLVPSLVRISDELNTQEWYFWATSSLGDIELDRVRLTGHA